MWLEFVGQGYWCCAEKELCRKGAPEISGGISLSLVKKNKLYREILGPAGFSPPLLSANRIGPRDACGTGGRKLHLPRKEQVGRQLRGGTELCAGCLEVGPGRRRCPRGHGAGGALGDTQVRAAAPPGNSTAEKLGRCGAGKKGCCPHCSLVAP